MLKPTCPLFVHPCMEIRCAWWSSEQQVCIVTGIFNELTARKTSGEDELPSDSAKSVKKGQ